MSLSASSTFGNNIPNKYPLKQSVTQQVAPANSVDSLAPYFSLSSENNLHHVQSSVGVVLDKSDNTICSCVLISRNIILLTSHAITNIFLNSLFVKFGQLTFSLKGIIERSISLDYTILEINPVILENKQIYPGDIVHVAKIKRPDFVYSTGETSPSYYSHLYYFDPFSGDNNLIKVSVSSNYGCQGLVDNVFLNTFPTCSGGGYFNEHGELIGIHLGSDHISKKLHGEKQFLNINKIVDYAHNGLIRRILRLPTGMQTHQGNFTTTSFYYEGEGRKSSDIFSEAFPKSKYTEKKLDYNNDGALTFTSSNLKKSSKISPDKFNKSLEKCTYYGGLHRHTREYSVIGYIESDHIIPYNSFKLSESYNYLCRENSVEDSDKKSVKRPGENDLPAITIPKKIHGLLKSTGSSKETSEFHTKLAEYLDKNKGYIAIYECLEDYERNKLIVQSSKAGLRRCLKEYEKLKIINRHERAKLIEDFHLRVKT